MTEEMRMWVEILFNLTYLCLIWGLVIMIWRRRAELPPAERAQANLIVGAFGLLALGDTGHVGFRVWAYASGGLEAQVAILGRSLSLVAAGAFMTAVTVTLFYVLMLELWRVRFHQHYGPFEWILLAAAGLRLALMALPQNEWNSLVPVQPWSLIRNLPLMLQGLGLAYLILRDARRVGDRTYFWIGICILISFACYAPVIFFVQQAPLLGMLMIPKTIAYLAIGLLCYQDLFRGRAADKPGVLSQTT